MYFGLWVEESLFSGGLILSPEIENREEDKEDEEDRRK